MCTYTASTLNQEVTPNKKLNIRDTQIDNFSKNFQGIRWVRCAKDL